jgi:hypothetical protein
MSLQYCDRYTPGLKLIINTNDLVLPGGDLYGRLTVIPEHCSVTFTVAGRTNQQLVFGIQHTEYNIQDPKKNHNVREAEHIELIEYAPTGGDITIQFNTTAASYKQLATAIRDEDESATQGTMTFVIHFDRIGAVKFTAPFIWKCHDSCKKLDKLAHKAEKAAIASAVAAGAEEAVAKAAGAAAFEDVFIPLATWELGPAFVSE